MLCSAVLGKRKWESWWVGLKPDKVPGWGIPDTQACVTK